MEALTPQDESALLAHLEASRKRLDVLAGELRAVDAELEEVEVDRPAYALLRDLCGSLEKLDEQDASSLFWEGLAGVDAGQGHVRVVRERVDAFDQQLNQIEASRQTILAKILREEENGAYIEDDLYELKQAEEDRRHEWIVEREMDALPDRPSIMPWTRGGEDDQRFRRSMALTLLIALVIGAVSPWIPLPIPDPWEVAEVPDRFTRLIREEPVAPPPVQELQAKPEQPEALEETPLLAEEGVSEPTEKPLEPAPPGAASKGILAFREQFSSLAESDPTAKLGSQARIANPGEVESGRPTRSLVTTPGPGSSGGIDLASLSRNVGDGAGQGIEGVKVTQATSSIGAIGGAGTDRPLSSGPGSSRTDEEIQIVFDRHKAALYRLYNRELRKNPTLQGQMVLRLTIEPDGSVSLCELHSTDIKAPNLASRVVERVETFDFGAKDGIPAITILYPIDFLPAT